MRRFDHMVPAVYRGNSTVDASLLGSRSIIRRIGWKERAR